MKFSQQRNSLVINKIKLCVFVRFCLMTLGFGKITWILLIVLFAAAIMKPKQEVNA
jgi:hypothetical protein